MTCHTPAKIGHPTKQAAKQAAAVGGRKSRAVYKCMSCGKWHVTHKRTQRRPQSVGR